MVLKCLDPTRCDVLVIGGGGAGLTAAIRAKEAGAAVIIVSKTRVGYGNNTFISKGVFAAAKGYPNPADNPEVHIRDTLDGGRWINDIRLVREVAENAAAQISFLDGCGSRFAKREGSYQVTQAPGHRYPRHVRGENHSGRDFILPLRAYARRIGVHFAEQVFITRLFSWDGRFNGAVGINHEGELMTFISSCAILATGGFGQVYRYTNNASGITGDGHALAYDLGLPLRDMEFVQFYPTAMSKGTRILLYEHFVARAGAVLRNALGEDILVRHGLTDPMAVTRDQLVRTVMKEVIEGRGIDDGVIMDLESVPKEELDRSQHLLPRDLSLEKPVFQVSPTVHFCMGGIAIDHKTRTAITGLFGAGEICGGVHGANRLAGNALSEVFSMGGRAGVEAAESAGRLAPPEEIERDQLTQEVSRLQNMFRHGRGDLRQIRQAARGIMWTRVGIIRDGRGLKEALNGIEDLREQAADIRISNIRTFIKFLELRNMFQVMEMVCRAALMREESRGAHFRNDYPEENNHDWLKTILIRKEDQAMMLASLPVRLEGGPAAPQ